jgi:type II secretory pathway component PulM
MNFIKMPERLTGRDKLLIAGAGTILVVFLVFQLVYVPLIRSRVSYQSRARELEERLKTMNLLAETYTKDRARYQAIAGALSQKAGASVLTYLEEEARRAGIRDSIEYVKPMDTRREESLLKATVEMKIDAVGLADLVRFLSGAQAGRQGLTVTYLRLKPFFKDRTKADAIVRLTDSSIEQTSAVR